MGERPSLGCSCSEERHCAPPSWGGVSRWASLFRGKEHGMKRLILLLVTISATMVVALMMVAMAVPVFAGGAGDDEDKDNQSASGGSASTNGQTIFRRWFDPDHTKGALFAMNPDGSHIRQITHPRAGMTTIRRGLPMGRGSP